MEGPRLTSNSSVGDAIRHLSAAFRVAGLDGADSDARILVLASTGLNRADLVRDPDRSIGPGLDVILAARERRLQREPVSRILGIKEFWSLELEIESEVLDPRPDTETLVEAALEFLACRRDEALRILDLGSGSGALLCALLTEFRAATGVAIDLSLGACRVARRNFSRHGLANRTEVRQGDWGSAAPQRFDLVVSNPPYVASDEIEGLDPEVRLYDPLLALDGGPDGLRPLRAISGLLQSLLKPGGLAVFEIGSGQAEAAAALIRDAHFELLAVRQDLHRQDRAVICRSPGSLKVKVSNAENPPGGGLGAGGEND